LSSPKWHVIALLLKDVSDFKHGGTMSYTYSTTHLREALVTIELLRNRATELGAFRFPILITS
jgi:hypothetical protein